MVDELCARQAMICGPTDSGPDCDDDCNDTTVRRGVWVKQPVLDCCVNPHYHCHTVALMYKDPLRSSIPRYLIADDILRDYA